LILVGQSFRFAMIAVNGERRSISDPTSKTSLRSFLRKFGRRGNDATGAVNTPVNTPVIFRLVASLGGTGGTGDWKNQRKGLD
jgi:hypothetical protein